MEYSLPLEGDKFQQISLIFEAECDTSVTRFYPQVAIDVRNLLDAWGLVLRANGRRTQRLQLR